MNKNLDAVYRGDSSPMSQENSETSIYRDDNLLSMSSSSENISETNWKQEFLKEYINIQEKLVTQSHEFPKQPTDFLPKMTKELVNMMLNHNLSDIHSTAIINLMKNAIETNVEQMETSHVISQHSPSAREYLHGNRGQKESDSLKMDEINESNKLLPSPETSKFFSSLMDCDGKVNVNYQEFIESWHEYQKAALANNMDPNALITQSARMSKKAATRETTSILKSWLNEHKRNPYPTKGEKIMLAVLTRMNLTQVSTWFANARRRLKKENKMTWNQRNRNESIINNNNSSCLSSQSDNETEKIMKFNMKHYLNNNPSSEYEEQSHGPKVAGANEKIVSEIQLKSLLQKLQSSLTDQIPQLEDFIRRLIPTQASNDNLALKSQPYDHEVIPNDYLQSTNHSTSNVIGYKRPSSIGNNHETNNSSAFNQTLAPTTLPSMVNNTAASSNHHQNEVNKRPKIWSLIEIN